MGVFLAILMMMTTGSVAIFAIVRIIRNKYKADVKMRMVLFDLVAATSVVFTDLMTGDPDLILRLPFDMMISLFPIMVITTSLWDEKIAHGLSKVLSGLVLMLAVFNLSCIAGVFSVFPADHFISLSGFLLILMCLSFLFAISLRMREIRQVMRNGNVWSSICLTMDIIYLLAVVICVTAFLVAASISYTYAQVTSALVAPLMAGEIAALGLRVVYDSNFLIWRRHERRIIESMKISQTEVAQDSSKINAIYKDIYARLVNLFETERPYLNSELTINDIVKVTFTNKLYISRAISQFTGRNFCQFVNYYRVLHSIQIFRDNPDLKVAELAMQSGFNSTVSFSMAFRLYMSECPSDWCRREKLKLHRRKK